MCGPATPTPQTPHRKLETARQWQPQHSLWRREEEEKEEEKEEEEEEKEEKEEKEEEEKEEEEKEPQLRSVLLNRPCVLHATFHLAFLPRLLHYSHRRVWSGVWTNTRYTTSVH